jgi:hypothetical protein
MFWSDQCVVGWRSWHWTGTRLKGVWSEWESAEFVAGATPVPATRLEYRRGINAVKSPGDVFRFANAAGVIGSVEYGYRSSHAHRALGRGCSPGSSSLGGLSSARIPGTSKIEHGDLTWPTSESRSARSGSNRSLARFQLSLLSRSQPGSRFASRLLLAEPRSEPCQSYPGVALVPYRLTG